MAELCKSQECIPRNTNPMAGKTTSMCALFLCLYLSWSSALDLSNKKYYLTVTVKFGILYLLNDGIYFLNMSPLLTTHFISYTKLLICCLPRAKTPHARIMCAYLNMSFKYKVYSVYRPFPEKKSTFGPLLLINCVIWNA